MSATEADKLVKRLAKEQRKLLKELKEVRELEVTSKQELEKSNAEFGRLEDDMARAHRTKAYELFTGDEWEEMGGDPRDPEGKPSQEWGELFLERMLRHDEGWQATIQEFYDKQNELVELKNVALQVQSNVISLQENLMSLNAEIRLHAAYIQASHVVEVNPTTVVSGSEEHPVGE
jgi:hypothetical protein